jgi:hypothetical protein
MQTPPQPVQSLALVLVAEAAATRDWLSTAQ